MMVRVENGKRGFVCVEGQKSAPPLAHDHRTHTPTKYKSILGKDMIENPNKEI